MKRIIVTTGPSFLHKGIIRKYHQKRYIYRINGSHNTVRDIEKSIKKIRKQVPEAEILVDLPGNKIRTNLLKPIRISKNKTFILRKNQLNFADFSDYIKKGDLVYANDSIFLFVIKEVHKDHILLLSKSDGILTNGKGIHIRGVTEKLPFLFKKDLEIIDLVNREKTNFVGLSFVRSAKDIIEAKKIIRHSKIISKIETKSAVDNLMEILELVDYILIDRGDLSTDIGLVKVPYFQRHIIEKALLRNKKVFLATQFLKTMENTPIPTIAEVVDLTHTLKQGIHGIQLSEEIAIGKFPINCLKLIEEIEKNALLEKI